MENLDAVLERIKGARKAKGMTQQEMSEKIGMAKNNYGKLENGRIELTVKRLYEIAEILGIGVFSLLGEDVGNQERNSALNKELEFLREEKLKFDKLTLDLAPLFGNIARFFAKSGKAINENDTASTKLSDDFGKKLHESLKEIDWNKGIE